MAGCLAGGPGVYGIIFTGQFFCQIQFLRDLGLLPSESFQMNFEFNFQAGINIILP
jgi:hypothetical protein